MRPAKRRGAMFLLAKLTDSVRIMPADFRKRLTDAVTDELNKKYSNKVCPLVAKSKFGAHCGAGGAAGRALHLPVRHRVNRRSAGGTDRWLHTHQGCAFAPLYANVTHRRAVVFRLVVFRPFIGEVILGKIKACTPQGVHGASCASGAVAC